MSQQIVILLLSSILIPVWISISKFKSINRTYFPFLLFLWLSALTDLICNLFQKSYIPIYSVNIYYLFESLLFLWQFNKLKIFKNNYWPNFLAIAFIIFWAVEFLLLIQTNYYSRKYFAISYFCCFYTLLFTIFSINKICHLGTFREIKLTTNPVFFICSAFILYYTYSCIMSVFWMPNLKVTITPFYYNVYSLMYVIIFICNFIYA